MDATFGYITPWSRVQDSDGQWPGVQALAWFAYGQWWAWCYSLLQLSLVNNRPKFKCKAWANDLHTPCVPFVLLFFTDKQLWVCHYPCPLGAIFQRLRYTTVGNSSHFLVMRQHIQWSVSVTGVSLRYCGSQIHTLSIDYVTMASHIRKNYHQKLALLAILFM